MIDWFKAFIARWREMGDMEVYRDGYDWALDELRGKRFSPFDMQLLVHEECRCTEFCKGVLDAVVIFCQVHPELDDRD